MKLSSLSLHELDAKKKSIEDELARRERIRVACDFVDKHVADLAGEVAEVVDWVDMPERGHLPGQVVVFEGQRYRNVSRRCVTVPPGEVLVVWEPVEEPEPEPEPEPESVEPEEPVEPESEEPVEDPDEEPEEPEE